MRGDVIAPREELDEDEAGDEPADVRLDT